MDRQLWDQDEKYIEQRIRWTTRGLLGEFGLTQDDLQDLQQEFRLDIMVRLRSFNPDRAKRRTFISRIIANKAATIIESRRAQKRDFTKQAVSLSDEAPGPESGTVSRLELAEADDFKNRVRGRFLSYQPHHELVIDLSAVLPELSPEHRLICELLSEGGRVADVAQRLRCSRATVYDRIKAIRQRFLREGIRP